MDRGSHTTPMVQFLAWRAYWLIAHFAPCSDVYVSSAQDSGRARRGRASASVMRGAATIVVAACLLSVEAVAQQTPTGPLDSLTAIDLAQGNRLFDANCARCHGVAGTGGFGPSLRRPRLRGAPNDSTLMEVITSGIEDTEMPGAWWVSAGEARRIAYYVRSLGRMEQGLIMGDSARGQALFAGRGGCQACHMVRGFGTPVGPELSDIGPRRGVAFLRQSLLDPAAAVRTRLAAASDYTDYLVVWAAEASGRVIRGVRVNEDTFTIQIRDSNGRIHSLRKHDLRVLERRFGESLMPSYRGTLTGDQVDDVVAYLARLRGER